MPTISSHSLLTTKKGGAKSLGNPSDVHTASSFRTVEMIHTLTSALCKVGGCGPTSQPAPQRPLGFISTFVVTAPCSSVHQRTSIETFEQGHLGPSLPEGETPIHLRTGKFSGICHAWYFTRPALTPIHTCGGHKPLRKCDMYKMES